MPGLDRRPSLKTVDVDKEGGLKAALTSPERRGSLKPTFTRDSSGAKIEASATARKAVDPALLDEVRSRKASITQEDLDGAAVRTDMEVWVPDKERVWVQGKVTQQIGRAQLLVTTADGHQVKVDMEHTPELYTVNPQHENDMTSLWYLHEPGVLDNLRIRFNMDEPYTNVAHLLIAVNPLKRTPQPEMEAISKVKSLQGVSPHPYVIAEMSYRALMQPPAVRQSQSIVVSGESGAGKTESAKILMRYITWRSGATKSQDGHTATINDRIVQSNPILESLGNAKTQRNHNSSRFGKYISIKFGEKEPLTLVGASIETYLLEKSRIVYQLKGERCYHIYYLMLAGGSPEQLQQWKLTKPEDYHYLNTSGMITVPQLDDKAEFGEFCSACAAMDLQVTERDQLLACMAGLLHLGNVEFEESKSDGPSGAMSPRGNLGGISEGAEDKSGVSKKQTVANMADNAKAAELLGIDPEKLVGALTTRKMITSKGGETETFLVQLDGQKCVYTRDALTKAVYSALFDWSVKFLNQKLDADKGGDEAPFIGILDIFGFESFAVNGLEQLLINFANEKLQATFNAHVFAAEQELYAEEGISWKSVTWPDNSGCISLISQKAKGKTPGLLHLLDEQGRMPKATDADLCKRLHDSHSKDPFFPRPDPRKVKEVFKVLHYAGEVEYTVAGFLDKNNDTVNRDLIELCVSSTNSLLAGVFQELKDLQAAADTAGAIGGSRGSGSTTPRGAPEPPPPPAPKGSPVDVTSGGMTQRQAAMAKMQQDAGKRKESEANSGAARRGSSTSKVFTSVGVTFMGQMNKMVDELNKTRCNFIRCIKPNYQMQVGLFDTHYIVLQLRHTGMLQCCELLKHGYPTRIGYAEIKDRYVPLLPKEVTQIPFREGDFAGAILYGYNVPRDLYQLGSTRLFFRAGGVAALDELRHCDMKSQGPQLIKRIKRWIVLRRWRRAVNHTCMGNSLCWLLRRVRALAMWRFALRVAFSYLRTLRPLYRKVVKVKRAVLIQSFARMYPLRKKFMVECAHVFAARNAAKQAELEEAASVRIQALLRGKAQRKEYKETLAAIERLKVESPAATFIQSYFRGVTARKEYERRLAVLMETLIPKAQQLQAWWRTVRGEKVLRKVRSVVDRYTEGHTKLVREFVAMNKFYKTVQAAEEGPLTADQKFLLEEGYRNRGSPVKAGAPPTKAGPKGKKFEMWVSLRVGLGEDDKDHKPWDGTPQIFSARSGVLKKPGAGIYFSSFFGDGNNADERKDEKGHYIVPRRHKHFEAILDYIRDGSITLPKAYTPTTYDNRPASTEEQELLEFLREAHFYGIEELVNLVMPKVIVCRYGTNEQLLKLLRERGVLAS